MTEKIKSIAIYETKNYDLFKMNEDFKKMDIKELLAYVDRTEEKGHYLSIPIIVKEQDGKFLILEGNQRYLTCVLANKPIRFEVVEDQKALKQLERMVEIEEIF